MAKEGETQGYTRRLKDTIKKNEKKISALEKQLKDHNENCVAEKNDLRRQIEKLERENDELRQQITTMKTEIKDYKKSNDFLEESVKQQQTEIKDLKESKDCLDKRVKQLEKKFEMSEDQLCIGQLLIDVEKNFCKLVLEEFYDEHGNHNPKYMLDHIRMLIKDEGKRREAKDRWILLKEEIRWDPYIRKMLKPIKEERNDVAHPTLTEERIRKAKESLKVKSETMSEAVETLTSMWKRTNSKLKAKNVATKEKQIQQTTQWTRMRGLTW